MALNGTEITFKEIGCSMIQARINLPKKKGSLRGKRLKRQFQSHPQQQVTKNFHQTTDKSFCVGDIQYKALLWLTDFSPDQYIKGSKEENKQLSLLQCLCSPSPGKQHFKVPGK